MNESRWQALGVWYALRPARERLILLVAAVVLLAYVWFMLAFETLEAVTALEPLSSRDQSNNPSRSSKRLFILEEQVTLSFPNAALSQNTLWRDIPHPAGAAQPAEFASISEALYSAKSAWADTPTQIRPHAKTAV